MKIDIYKSAEETRVDGRPIMGDPVLFRRPDAELLDLTVTERISSVYIAATSVVAFRVRYCRSMKPFKDNFKAYHVVYDGLRYDIVGADFAKDDHTRIEIRCSRVN